MSADRFWKWVCSVIGHHWSYGEWYRRVGAKPTQWTRERSCWRCHVAEETETFCRTKPLNIW